MRTNETSGAASRPSTINELCDRYLGHAEQYYCSPPDANGARRPTGEAKNLRSALRGLRAVAGDMPPGSMSAEDLCAVQDWLLKRRLADGQPLSREYINKCCMMVRRCFRWATKPPQRWVPASVLEDLRLVEPLAYGRSSARETEDVQEAAEGDFLATLKALGELSEEPRRASQALCLSVMLDLHWHTGMRPGELVSMKRNELRVENMQLTLFDPAFEMMIYRPTQHKGRHRGFDRRIYLSDTARGIVETWLPRARWDGRLFPYTTSSYRQAVRRINREFNIPSWTPNQIRHSFAKRMRAAAGLDVVQAVMGHRHRSTSEIYAPPDQASAIEAIRRYA